MTPTESSPFAARWYGLLAVLFVAALAVSGCSSRVEVLQPSPAPGLAVVTVTPARHALAIVAIDFEPPLSDVQSLAEGGVTLLVAVENQGLSLEESVLVTARLVENTGHGVQRDLLAESVILDVVAPGEITIARFEQVSDLPLRDSYELLIEAPVLPGETNSEDNCRRYDILIHSGE